MNNEWNVNLFKNSLFGIQDTSSISLSNSETVQKLNE